VYGILDPYYYCAIITIFKGICINKRIADLCYCKRKIILKTHTLLFARSDGLPCY